MSLPLQASLTAMLNDAQWAELSKLVNGLNAQQLNWLSGYLAGVAQQQGNNLVPASEPQATEQTTLTILYGSQTGNAKGVAGECQARAEAAGLQVKLVNMADYKPRQLKNESHLLVVVSTHGEGDAPDDAIELHGFLAGKKAPELTGLRYGVIGLGDSSYEFFCQTGKDFDQRLSGLGATPMCERLDCDVDYDDAVTTWSQALIELLGQEIVNRAIAATTAPATVNLAQQGSQYSKKNPFTASLLDCIKITGRDSVKDIRHVEIDLAGSGLTYQPGDALGVWFDNDPQLVAELLDLLSLDGSAEVMVDGQAITLQAALQGHLELTQSYPKFVEHYAEFTGAKELQALLADKAVLREYLAQRQIIDIVRAYPAKLEATQLVQSLRGLTPRLYSIASSQAEVEDEVHLTVARVAYDAFGYAHVGGASGYLSDTNTAERGIRVFVESNDNFRLPENNDVPVIMIGPGTGIAPFRGFMQQRQANGAQGDNWLFFGNPNFTQDFLYQTEWQALVKDGLLTKVSLAFSRDQQEKIYVQHRIIEQGQELYRWLERGAHVYVCGDANHMTKDVEHALLQIIAAHGSKTEQQAAEYLTELRKAKRYQKDVY